MSTDNVEARRRLLEEIDAKEASLRKMIADMLAATPADDEEGGRGGKTDLGGPVEMELRPHEHDDYVIVLAGTMREGTRLVETRGPANDQALRSHRGGPRAAGRKADRTARGRGETATGNETEGEVRWKCGVRRAKSKAGSNIPRIRRCRRM